MARSLKRAGFNGYLEIRERPFSLALDHGKFHNENRIFGRERYNGDKPNLKIDVIRAFRASQMATKAPKMPKGTANKIAKGRLQRS